MIKHETRNLKKLNESNAVRYCTEISVGAVTSLRVGQSRYCASIPGRGTKLSVLSPAASCTITRAISLAVNNPGRKSKDGIVFRTSEMTARCCTFTPLFDFIAKLKKHRIRLTLFPTQYSNSSAVVNTRMFALTIFFFTIPTFQYKRRQLTYT